MKILQINKFHWMKGGSEAAYLGLLDLLQQHGHLAVSFSMKDRRNLSSAYGRFFVEHVDYESGALRDKIAAAAKIIYSVDARDKMRLLLSELQPDVAHFHIFQHQISPSVFGPLHGKNIPLVLTMHDLKPLCPNYKMLTNGRICEKCKGRKFYHCFLNKCSKGSRLKSLVNTLEMYFHYAMGYYQSVDKFIAVSDFYRKKMVEFGFPEHQVVHIPNFIDATRFQFSTDDKGYGLYFGRLSEEKGVATLLHALSSCPEIPFFIVGSGPLEADLKRLATEINLVNVKFCGFQTGEALQKLLREASFTVIPSEWYENCPMSVLESLSMGKPVIGAQIGGIPELIDDGLDGLIFESGNPRDLAAKMKLLWGNPALRRSMGLHGRNKVERDYNPEKHYDRIMAVYNEVLKV